MKTIILSILLVSSVAHAANKDEYHKLVCKGKVCHVVKVPKVNTDVTYLDMSELEGKTDDMPTITKKGKL